MSQGMNVPLIGQPNPVEMEYMMLMPSMEFQLFTDLVKREYDRARIDQIKARVKDAKAALDVEITLPMRVANMAVRAFMTAHSTKRASSADRAAASDLRKEAESNLDAKEDPAAAAPSGTSAGGIIVP